MMLMELTENIAFVSEKYFETGVNECELALIDGDEIGCDDDKRIVLK